MPKLCPVCNREEEMHCDCPECPTCGESGRFECFEENHFGSAIKRGMYRPLVVKLR